MYLVEKWYKYWICICEVWSTSYHAD